MGLLSKDKEIEDYDLFTQSDCPKISYFVLISSKRLITVFHVAGRLCNKKMQSREAEPIVLQRELIRLPDWIKTSHLTT